MGAGSCPKGRVLQAEGWSKGARATEKAGLSQALRCICRGRIPSLVRSRSFQADGRGRSRSKSCFAVLGANDSILRFLFLPPFSRSFFLTKTRWF